MKLGEEECEKCDLHEKHHQGCHRLRQSFVKSALTKGDMKTFDGCDDGVGFTKHITTTTAARSLHRKEKEREWEKHEVAMSVDMQKVIKLPRLPGLRQVIFCTRLVLFNETFELVGGWKKSKTLRLTGVLRNEAIKGSSAEDVASAFIHFICKNHDIQRFISWVDNCSAQNKSWFQFTALANEVTEKTPQYIQSPFNIFNQAIHLCPLTAFSVGLSRKCRKKP